LSPAALIIRRHLTINLRIYFEYTDRKGTVYQIYYVTTKKLSMQLIRVAGSMGQFAFKVRRIYTSHVATKRRRLLPCAKMKKIVVICIIVVVSVNTVPPSSIRRHKIKANQKDLKNRPVHLTEVYTRKGRTKLRRFQPKYLLEFQHYPLDSSLQSFDYFDGYNSPNLCKLRELRPVWRA